MNELKQIAEIVKSLLDMVKDHPVFFGESLQEEKLMLKGLQDIHSIATKEEGTE